ncbi:GGDEF domain-containing protein [Paenibacillus methanolicus]|uniref:Diguanylate cyclase (GGDEF)-like protein n=1 Tax=Paenibacillus methanolicus TaxID=582686 RepID=A0A5S5C7M1_9BACL|nr:GGDEF domain-containing protein [Paenibacillus methanolicus]TYP75405.1 diguanylate cyclase (GGDEF)-like protein [Paenibacillus methanolicus]
MTQARLRVYILSLFLIAALIAVSTFSAFVPTPFTFRVMGVYWLFSLLYYHLRVNSRRGSTSIEYGINYNLSLILFTGPFGLFLFEAVYRLAGYLYKKKTKTDEPDEGIQSFYNVGSFVIQGTAAYYVYQWLLPWFDGNLVAFWLLVFLLIAVTAVLSDLFLLGVFGLLGDIRTRADAAAFLKERSILDMAKTSFSNGLLLLFLEQRNWTAIIGLFVLNYLVSQSYLVKAQIAQDKHERNKYEHMAYTDFLTGLHNRAYMEMKMKELEKTKETIGIVVADIDKFKTINDTYNHSVGDRVIQHFAAALKEKSGPDDILARSGGEEFTMFLRGRSYETCLALVEELRRQVERDTVEAEFRDETKRIAYTASFGLYFFTEQEEVPIEKGYIYADQLLLESKQLGRNRITANAGQQRESG